MAPGTPVGASLQRLATSLRSTPAISAGALANLFQAVKTRLDHRGAELRIRLRRRRLLGSDEPRARVNGHKQRAWVCQHAEVCIHVSRPSRGHGVSQEGLGAHRPVVWVSDLYSAHKHHPAEQWQVC
jgi:transposase